jgi:hypothetical protein
LTADTLDVFTDLKANQLGEKQKQKQEIKYKKEKNQAIT